MKARKQVKPIELRIPPPVGGITDWIVFGLDPSLSRTGYSITHIGPDESTGITSTWIEVGSIKPENAADPVWIRSKATALALREKLYVANDWLRGRNPLRGTTGLIISFEAPTPRNDFLTSISRILHLVLLDKDGPAESYAQVNIQLTNAATMRRLMGLVQRGTQNKKENVAKAYTFLDQGRYPNLDTDACDSVLMSIMARHTAEILMGSPETVPERFLIALCDGTMESAGKGTRTRIRTKGILHRPEYWSTYKRRDYAVMLRDARVKKARLDKVVFSI